MVEPSNSMLPLQIFYWKNLVTYYVWMAKPGNSYCEEVARYFLSFSLCY